MAILLPKFVYFLITIIVLLYCFYAIKISLLVLHAILCFFWCLCLDIAKLHNFSQKSKYSVAFSRVEVYVCGAKKTPNILSRISVFVDKLTIKKDFISSISK